MVSHKMYSFYWATLYIHPVTEKKEPVYFSSYLQ